MVKLQASGNKGRKDPVISIYFCITINSSAAILGVLLDQHKLFVPAMFAPCWGKDVLVHGDMPDF